MSDSNPRVRDASATQHNADEPSAESRDQLRTAVQSASLAAARAVGDSLGGSAPRGSFHVVVMLIAHDPNGFLLTSSGGIISASEPGEAEVNMLTGTVLPAVEAAARAAIAGAS